MAQLNGEWYESRELATGVVASVIRVAYCADVQFLL